MGLHPIWRDDGEWPAAMLMQMRRDFLSESPGPLVDAFDGDYGDLLLEQLSDVTGKISDLASSSAEGAMSA